MKKVIKLALVGIILLQGCTSPDAYTGNNKVNKAAIGAGVGVLTGVLAGVIAGGNAKERRKNALIGAAAGGLIGGGAGYYMDKQESTLREKLRNSGISVSRNNNQITLNMPGNITFKSNQSDINSNFYDTLNSVVIIFKEFDKTNIAVEGHTDSIGSDQYNNDLSRKRAQSVASYFSSQGVSQYRLKSIGYGESNPIADNNTNYGRAANRRVEIKLTPIN